MAEGPPSGPGNPRKRGFFANVGALVFARGFLTVSQILVLPIIARYLSVEEFAVMALAMTVVIFTSILSDAGLGRSLIRSIDYNPAEWSTVFWLLVAVGSLLGAVVLTIAPAWAWFFGQPLLWQVLSALAVVPFFQALSAAFNAEIERRENYTGLARVNVFSASAGLVAAVVLALVGAGIWALVAQQVLLAFLRFISVVVLSQFRPSFVFSPNLLKEHVRFSRDAILVSLLSTLQSQSAVVFIGKILGDAALGLFAMSQRFTRLPQFGIAGPMSAVVYVRMAKVQTDPEALRRLYLASSRLVAAALFPPFALIAAASTPVFTVFLSDKWAGVASVFALSIPGLVLEAVTVTYLACLFRALGRTELQLRLKLEGVVLSLVLVLGAAFISLEAVAASLTVWSLLYVFRGWKIAGRVVPLGLYDCVNAIARPLILSGLAVLAQVGLQWAFDPAPIFEIGVAVFLTLLTFGLLALIDWSQLKDAISAFR